MFQIGLCGVVEADLELFRNSWSVGFLGERLYGSDKAGATMASSVATRGDGNYGVCRWEWGGGLDGRSVAWFWKRRDDVVVDAAQSRGS